MRRTEKVCGRRGQKGKKFKIFKTVPKADFLSLLQTPGNEYKWMDLGLFWKTGPRKIGFAQLLHTKTHTLNLLQSYCLSVWAEN